MYFMKESFACELTSVFKGGGGSFVNERRTVVMVAPCLLRHREKAVEFSTAGLIFCNATNLKTATKDSRLL